MMCPVTPRKILSLSVSLFATALFAEVGDIHTVATGVATVHENPERRSAAVQTLKRGDEVGERAAQGEWYQVQIPSSALSGWVHFSQLARRGGENKADDTPPSQAQVSAGAKSARLETLEARMREYNDRTRALHGYTPYAGAEELDDGGLRVTVTAMWRQQSTAKRKSSLTALHAIWKQVTDGDARIIAVDSQGREVASHPPPPITLDRSRPAPQVPIISPPR